jgi:hypothetical protein
MTVQVVTRYDIEHNIEYVNTINSERALLIVISTAMNNDSKV